MKTFLSPHSRPSRSRLARWLLAEATPGDEASADISLSALRVVLLSSLVLAALVGGHTGVMALQRGKPFALVIVVVVMGLLVAALRLARSGRSTGALLLLGAVYAAAIGITISTGTQPELSRLGYVLSYTTPLAAGLMVNWRLALALMVFNALFFWMAVTGTAVPQLPMEQVRLPGSLLYVHATLFLFFNVCMPLAVFRVMQAMRKTQEQLRLSRALSERVFQAASAPTLVCGAGGEVLRANQPFLSLCGVEGEMALRGRPVAALFRAPVGETRAWSDQAGLRWRLAELAELSDWTGPPESSGSFGPPAREVQLHSVRSLEFGLQVYSFDDVTELRRTQADLAASVRREAWAIWHDPLTGLSNRSHAIQLLDEWRADAARGPLGLVTLRLCNLRQLNARYGVAACDQLLRDFAAQLQRRLPPGARTARVRGSVLAVLLPGVAQEDELAAAVRRLRASLPEQFTLDRQTVLPDLAFGLLVPAGVLDRQPGADGAELLRCCELALDMAQDPRWREACGGVMLFNAGAAQSVARSMAVEAELPQALGAGQLHLVYQPQLCTEDGRLLGFEALVRWHSPALGEVSPAEFIPVAEACGLVGAITDWVIEAACAQLAAWRREAGTEPGTEPGTPSGTPLHVAINLSARDLDRPGLFEVLQSAMARHGIQARQLELEVTESALARHPTQALQQLQRLHAAGFSLAIDDFGTGYSSLAKLVDLPIDVIKIDRSFLRELPGDARRERVVRSMVSLAHSLRLGVVAEGVETLAQQGFLQALGVQVVQGYLHGRPERAAHWADWVADRGRLVVR